MTKEREQSSHQRSSQHWWSACLLLAALGLAVSAYLLSRTFALLTEPRPGTFDLCSALFSTDCDAALSDARLWFLGVPVAGWGLVYFSTLASLLLLGRFMGPVFAAEALLASLLMNLAGIGAGLALAFAALWGHASPCNPCLVVHAISVLLLLALLKASGTSVRGRVRLLRNATDWLFRSGVEASARER
jgi:uncharacterized membrane protein